MKRVVVTGMGSYTSYGLGKDLLWKNLIANIPAIKEVPDSWKIDPNRKGFYAPLPKLDYRTLDFSKSEILQFEPVTLNALLSIEEALKQANINLVKLNDKLNRYVIKDKHIDVDKIGIFGGTGIGGIETLSNATIQFAEVRSGKKVRLDALSVAKTMPYNIAAASGIKLSLHHNINSGTYACATGTILIGKAFESIKNATIDMAIICASEYADQEVGLLYNSFFYGNTLTKSDDITKANIPFDKNRNGFLFSEGGAGALVIESLEHAKKRGATILAEIIGFSDTFDGYNMVSPDLTGAYIEKMLLDLLSKASVMPEEISYINAHGTGTIKNDEVESLVLGKIFNRHTAINSTKSLLGHSISASGIIETITTILSIQNKKIHANNGLKDPISDLNFVKEPINLDIVYAISESFAFGGHNGALLFKKFIK